MSIANKTGWQQEFTVAVSVLVLKSGLNAQAIKRARNRLEQDGYITWRSRGGNQSAIYHLNSLVVQNDSKNVPQCEPQCEPQTNPQSVPQCEPQSVPIIKHKLNKTNIPPISPAETFEEYWDAYPKKGNWSLTEKAYVDVLLSGVSADDLLSAAHNYADTVKILETQERYVKNPDRFLSDNTFLEYLPGAYKKPEREKKKNQFGEFQQTDYDFDALERELLGG